MRPRHFLGDFDKHKQKLIEFWSDEDFDCDVVHHILDKVNRQQFHHKSFSNRDFPSFLLDKHNLELAQDDDFSTCPSQKKTLFKESIKS